ncbi:thioredoxin family protein [Halalkalibacterium ligniniphilum]|uniref:thioredoxin family protein n=1 Tax=Halalkalibacterium ligniniphilum TaxID=1134413 RepID=UPI000349CBB6|nr:thioredoxin family protein [Halalkalibacterium ligniniphilum]
MKKVIIFGGIVVLLFVSLAVVSTMQQTKKAEGNPFGKSTLHPATIDIMDDPNYQNVILPDELEERLTNGDDVTVYFYSSTCSFCKETTPRLAPLAQQMDVDLVQYNLLEFEQGWSDYNLQSTPTVVHYQNGKEVARVVGSAQNEEYAMFFSEHVLKNR